MQQQDGQQQQQHCCTAALHIALAGSSEQDGQQQDGQQQHCTEPVDRARPGQPTSLLQISQIGPIRDLTPIHTYGSMWV